jgi:putative addiction module component (TIGR02574 family)
MNAAATLDAVRNWPVEDQLDLVFRLWDQVVDSGWRPTPEPGLLEELNRRLTAHATDPTKALTWEQVIAHVRRIR